MKAVGRCVTARQLGRAGTVVTAIAAAALAVGCSAGGSVSVTPSTPTSATTAPATTPTASRAGSAPAKPTAPNVRYVNMAQPIGSVSTQVPAGWETARSDTDDTYQDPATHRITLTIGALTGKQSPEASLRAQAAATKSSIAGYHEIKLTDRLTDPVSKASYADWEYTYQQGGITYHRILRVYGADFGHPNSPVAWATIEFTAPADQFSADEVIFQHAASHITWDD